MALTQQTFLESSIRGFNASLGWGSEASSIEVRLVDDDRNIRDGFPSGDIFSPVDIGTPATFSYSGEYGSPWTYTGIVKSYKQDDSITGSPLYTVNMTDPREILQGTQIILDDYHGSVSGIPNILNAYGYMEDILALNSPNVSNYNGSFGGSEKNDTGIPWRNIQRAVGVIASGDSHPYYGERIRLRDREYTLNLSNLLPKMLPAEYRISNTDSVSVLDFIDEVCSAANYDYFVELQPLIDTNGNYVLDKNKKLVHQIDVVTVDRSYQPLPGHITQFVEHVSGASVKNIGLEFRNQTVGKFLLGGNVHSMYRVEDYPLVESGNLRNEYDYINDDIHEFWGLDSDGNILTENPFGGYPINSALVGRKRDINNNLIVLDDKGKIVDKDDPDYENFSQSGNFVNKYIDSDIFIDTRNLDDSVYYPDVYITNRQELRAIASSIEAWHLFLAGVAGYEYIPVNKQDVKYVEDNSDCVVTTSNVEKFKRYDSGYVETEDISPPIKYNKISKLSSPGSSQYVPVNSLFYMKFFDLRMSLGVDGNAVSEILILLNRLNGTVEGSNERNLISAELSKKIGKINIDNVIEHYEKVKKLYNYLYQYAKNYGTSYTVNLPDLLLYRDLDTSGIITSIEPASAGYLTSGELSVAISSGWLPENYYNLTSEDGRIYPYVKFRNCESYDLSEISEDIISYSRDSAGKKLDAYIKCSVSDKIVFIDNIAGSGAKAVITLPKAITTKEESEGSFRGASLQLINQIQSIQQTSSGVLPKVTFDVGADSNFEFMFPEAVQPEFVAIPIKSNVDSYGPWYKYTAVGATDYIRDESVVPWNYGSVSGMIVAARAKVDGTAVQQYDEYGSVEFPGTPTIPMGRQLQYLTSSGNMLGPYITNVRVSIGEDGVKTNYDMQTWAPNFGKLEKQYVDKLNKIGKDAVVANRLALHQKETGFNDLNADLVIDSSQRNYLDFLNYNDFRAKYSKTFKNLSSHDILAGQITGNVSSGVNFLNTNVVNQPQYNTVAQVKNDYMNKAFVSMDYMFTPYSTDVKHSGNLPKFIEPGSGVVEFASGRHPHIYDTYTFPFESGHNVKVFTSEDTIPENGLVNDKKHYSPSSNYRGLAFNTHRFVMAGYGLCTDGRPIPNASGYHYNESGEYVYNPSGNYGSHLFASGYQDRPDMWTVGPLDGFRFDRSTGMWNIGCKVIEGYLIEDLPATSGRLSNLPYTSGRMVLVDGSYAGMPKYLDSGNTVLNPYYRLWDRADASGEINSSGTIYSDYSSMPIESGGRPDLFPLLVNRSSRVSAPSGAYVIAVNMPNGENRPIWIDCEAEERDGIR